jgi:type I restriction enzyme, S subunit
LKDWKTYKLGDIVDQKRGISYGIVQPGQHDPEGIPILKVNNLTSCNFDVNQLSRVSPKIEKGYSRTRLQGGELLLSLVGTLGEIFQVTEQLVGCNVVRALAVIPILEEFTPSWVLQWFKSPIAQNQLKQIATTSVQATINLKELKEIKIPFPEIHERKAIASILSALDDKIELNLQTNKTLEEMAMTLYKHWFVDFGPFRDGNFVDSELGLIPEGWEVKRLGDICEVGSSKRIFLSEYVESGIPFLRGKEVIQLSKGQSISTELFIAAERFKSIKEKFGVPLKGDILISSVGTIGVSWMVDNENPFYFKDGNVTWIKNYSPRVRGSFISQWLKSPNCQEQIKSETIGSTQQALTISALKTLQIVLPPSESIIVNEVSKELELWNDQIVSNKLETQTLTTLRDTLLPKLISGEVRVREVEKILSDAL